jgi:hypothetical protein
MPRTAFRKNASTDSTLLAAALEGLELQRTRLDEQITQVRSMMGGGAVAKKRRGRPPRSAAAAPAAAATPRKRKKLSAAARAKIAAAQKKRWAEYHKKGG